MCIYVREMQAQFELDSVVPPPTTHWGVKDVELLLNAWHWKIDCNLLFN